MARSVVACHSRPLSQKLNHTLATSECLPCTQIEDEVADRGPAPAAVGIGRKLCSRDREAGDIHSRPPRFDVHMTAGAADTDC